MKTILVSLVVMLTAASANAGGTADPIDGVDESHIRVREGDPPLGQRVTERVDALENASNDASEAANSASSAFDQLTSMLDMFSALSELDAELDGRIGNDGAGPEVPSSCADNAACNDCFTRAYGEVNFVRNVLERLRTIARRTINYIKSAEGFGDSVSGVHGVSGLSWQYAKGGIEQERANFNRTTRAKYNDLVEAMRRALQQVGQCEQQHFNNPDWYNRYGFMYFNFIKESYQPPE